VAIRAGSRRRAMHLASRQPARLLSLCRRSARRRRLRLRPRVILLPARRLHPVLGGRCPSRHCSGLRLGAAGRPLPPCCSAYSHPLLRLSSPAGVRGLLHLHSGRDSSSKQLDPAPGTCAGNDLARRACGNNSLEIAVSIYHHPQLVCTQLMQQLLADMSHLFNLCERWAWSNMSDRADEGLSQISIMLTPYDLSHPNIPLQLAASCL
jgi:hypothetical protein